MADIISVVFGKDGGRTDKKLSNDLNRAWSFVKRASELENDPEKFQIAYQLLKEALRIDPDYMCALTRMCFICNAIGSHEEAYNVSKRAYELDPDDSLNVYNLGTACIHLGLYDEALVFLQKTIKIDPKLISAYHNIAVIYGLVDLPETAKKYAFIANKLKFEQS